jgi:endonuclease VIII
MPEGDTIAWHANRIRPVLEGRVPEEILTPHPRHAMDRWPERLAGRAVKRIDTHGKHMLLHFEGDLVLHSHLRMTGSWALYGNERPSPRGGRVWLVLRTATHQVVQFGGPVLELMTAGRARSDQRLAGLGPDVLAATFDGERFLHRLRRDDPTRSFGDALLDQRNVAGIGNVWKAEGCWEAQIDPWRPVAEVSDDEALAVIEAMRPRMFVSAAEGPRSIKPQVYRHPGESCPRCGARIRSRGQGDDNRTTYWCPGCQH